MLAAGNQVTRLQHYTSADLKHEGVIAQVTDATTEQLLLLVTPLPLSSPQAIPVTAALYGKAFTLDDAFNTLPIARLHLVVSAKARAFCSIAVALPPPTAKLLLPQQEKPMSIVKTIKACEIPPCTPEYLFDTPAHRRFAKSIKGANGRFLKEHCGRSYVINHGSFRTFNTVTLEGIVPYSMDVVEAAAAKPAAAQPALA